MIAILQKKLYLHIKELNDAYIDAVIFVYRFASCVQCDCCQL